MKKLAAVLILTAAITMTGCQGSKQEEKPAASKTEEVNQASDELKEKLNQVPVIFWLILLIIVLLLIDRILGKRRKKKYENL